MSLLRVFICGAHSTGKSTLLNDLRAHINLHIEEEVARRVVKAQGLTREMMNHERHPEVFERLQEDILKEQCVTERRNRENNTDYIADRGIDPVVYAMLYLGQAAMERILESDAAKECIERYRKSLIFVVTPHPECIVDDGVRIVPVMSELQQYTNIMQKLLTSLQIPYHVIDDLDRMERVRTVIREIFKIKPSAVLTE